MKLESHDPGPSRERANFSRCHACKQLMAETDHICPSCRTPQFAPVNPGSIFQPVYEEEKEFRSGGRAKGWLIAIGAAMIILALVFVIQLTMVGGTSAGQNTGTSPSPSRSK